jgi:hypothetical protein
LQDAQRWALKFAATHTVVWLYCALLLLAGGREHTQWVFLAAQSDHQQQADASAAAAAQPAMSPAILAVKLVGNCPTCIDWLESSTVSYSGAAAAAATPASAAKQQQQQQQLAATPAPTAAANRNAAGSSTSSVHTRTASRRLAVAHQQSNQQQQGSKETVVYIRNLILQRLDQANGMWVAVAPDTAEVTVAAAGKGSVGGGAAAAARTAELRRWAGQEQQFLDVLKAHVQRLVGV